MSIKDYEDQMWDIQITEDLADKIYRKQLKWIHWIKDLEWYKTISDYWNRVKDSADIELQSVKPEFLNIVQMKRRIADDFINFLENIEKAPYIEQQAKDATKMK